MSTEFEDNQSTGRPSEYGKAASSGARADRSRGDGSRAEGLRADRSRGDGSRRRSGAQPRSTYESEAQALADIWDPKKRKEREEAAAREAAEAAKAEAARAVAQEAAAREAAKAKKAAEVAAQEAERRKRDTVQEAERRKRIAALPTIETKRAAIDPAAVPTTVPATAPSVVPTTVPTAASTAAPRVVSTAAPTTVPTTVPTIDSTAVPRVSDSFTEGDVSPHATPQGRPKTVVMTAPPEAAPPEAAPPETVPSEKAVPPADAPPEKVAPLKDEGSKYGNLHSSGNDVEDGAVGPDSFKNDVEDEAVDPDSIADAPTVKAEGPVDGDARTTFEGNRPKKPSRRKPGQPNNLNTSGKSRKSVGAKRFAAWKVVLVIVASLLVVVVALVNYASLSRWVFVDDATDIKGSWHLSAEPVSIVISDTEMNLADEVSYTYTMDTQAKVINETLGNMKGAARYRFSEDRNSVAIFDDSSSDWLNNAMIDLRWYVDCAFAKVFGGESPDLLGGESGIIMYRAGYDAPGVVTMTTEVVEGDAGQQTAEGDAGQQATEGGAGQQVAEGDAQGNSANVASDAGAPSASE